ncbi:hypothetical protein F2Q69_00047981 [Brassica cretica]|uniref:Uncharacterized protein n=1 Tax=Brassica cretica TaxID=69181 RepID=A0A8S9PGZ6_BRACR|nr:hypothetical protein F2Q69_00047981 [Brassica cretica]
MAESSPASVDYEGSPGDHEMVFIRTEWERLAHHAELTAARFTEMDKRLAAYDTRFDAVDHRFDQLTTILLRMENNQLPEKAQGKAVASANYGLCILVSFLHCISLYQVLECPLEFLEILVSIWDKKGSGKCCLSEQSTGADYGSDLRNPLQTKRRQRDLLHWGEAPAPSSTSCRQLLRSRATWWSDVPHPRAT